MKITYNQVFKDFLSEYQLRDDFSFSIEIPQELQKRLNDQPVVTELGIALKSFNTLYKATQTWENQSIIEDNENHFHVDSYIEPADPKKAFMLGVKTLTLLAAKFQNENISGIRLWYSFQTLELAQLEAKQLNLADEKEEHFISDRLSFYKLRYNENVVSLNENESKFYALLIIDL